MMRGIRLRVLSGALVVVIVAGALYIRRPRPGPLAAVESLSNSPSALSGQVPTTGRQEASARAPSAPDPAASILAKLTRQPQPSAATTSELIERLNDPTQPLKVRRQAARALGQIGSDEAIAALGRAILDSPPSIKAAIGEGLGENLHPGA